MKTKLILLVVIISSMIGLIVITKKPIKPVTVNHIEIKKDSSIVVLQEQAINFLSNKIDSLESVAERSKKKSEILKTSISKLNIKLNDLVSRYKPDTTTCDSIVDIQSIKIDSLDKNNQELNIESESYSKALLVEKRICLHKDTIISSKESVINAYKSDYGRVNCFINWQNRHKFWTWILGVKCK